MTGSRVRGEQASKTWALAHLVVAVRAAEKGNAFGGSGVRLAGDAGPGAALRVPEITLDTVGFAGIRREHPAEEDVVASPPGVLQEPLPQVDVVSPHALSDAAAQTKQRSPMHKPETL